jgi:hypothetical protein
MALDVLFCNPVLVKFNLTKSVDLFKALAYIYLVIFDVRFSGETILIRALFLGASKRISLHFFFLQI